jgi:hypothetical protein
MFDRHWNFYRLVIGLVNMTSFTLEPQLQVTSFIAVTFINWQDKHIFFMEIFKEIRFIIFAYF